MWGVFNENGLIDSFDTEQEANECMNTKNRMWQTCGFYIEKVKD